MMRKTLAAHTGPTEPVDTTSFVNIAMAGDDIFIMVRGKDGKIGEIQLTREVYSNLIAAAQKALG
jgi:hypothetical protein